MSNIESVINYISPKISTTNSSKSTKVVEEKQEEVNDDLIVVNVPKSLYPNGLNYSDKIVRIRVRSIWLVHGSYAAVGSIFSSIRYGLSLTHWWVEIKCVDNNTNNIIYYCAQFGSDQLLRLSRHKNMNKCTRKGKSGCLRHKTKCDISNKYKRTA